MKERITEDTEEEREHGEGMRRPGAEASTRIGPELSGLKSGPISEAKAKYGEMILKLAQARPAKVLRHRTFVAGPYRSGLQPSDSIWIDQPWGFAPCWYMTRLRRFEAVAGASLIIIYGDSSLRSE